MVEAYPIEKILWTLAFYLIFFICSLFASFNWFGCSFQLPQFQSHIQEREKNERNRALKTRLRIIRGIHIYYIHIVDIYFFLLVFCRSYLISIEPDRIGRADNCSWTQRALPMHTQRSKHTQPNITYLNKSLDMHDAIKWITCNAWFMLIYMCIY